MRMSTYAARSARERAATPPAALIIAGMEQPYELFEAVGRHGDAAAAAFEAWASSAAADTRKAKNGAMTAPQILPLVVLAHQLLAQDANASLDLDARALGRMLSNAAAESDRFQKIAGKYTAYKIAPPLNYLESSTLPSNKKLVDRRTLKKLEAAAAERDDLKAQLADAERRAARVRHLVARVESLEERLRAATEPRRAAAAPGDDLGDASSFAQSYDRRVIHEHGFKVLVREAMAIMPACSTRQLPRLLATVARAYALQAKLSLSPEAIVRITPSSWSLRNWQDELGDVDDYALSLLLKNVADGVFGLCDAGNKKSKKMLFEMFSFWDFVKKCVQLKQISNFDCGGNGIANAAAMDASVERFDTHLLGTCTDSAGDVINTMVEELRKKYPGMSASACMLHVLNIILMNGYVVAFGDEEMGVAGALRRGFLTSYLVRKFPKEWKDFCTKKGDAEAPIPASASKGRWWSIVASHGDIKMSKARLVEFFTEMSNRLSADSTFRDLFKVAACWLEQPKIDADAELIDCFTTAWWSPAMLKCQQFAESMKDLDTKDRLGGFTSQHQARRCVTQHRGLVALADLGHEAWAPFRAKVEDLERGDVYLAAARAAAARGLDDVAVATDEARLDAKILRVPELRTALEALDLPTVGLKGTLVERITLRLGADDPLPSSVTALFAQAAARTKTSRDVTAAITAAVAEADHAGLRAALARAESGRGVDASLVANAKVTLGELDAARATVALERLRELCASPAPSERDALNDALVEAVDAGVADAHVVVAAQALGHMDAADARRQHGVFMRTATAYAEKHYERWLTDLVDTACADVPEVGDAMLRTLFAIYMGDEPPALEGTVTVEGDTLELAELIADMTQFATAESLRKRSVLFADEAVVDVIRIVLSSTSRPESKERAKAALERVMNARIRAMPNNTHCVERAVQTGATVTKDYAPHLSETKRSAMQSSIANNTRPEWCDGLDEFRKSAAACALAASRQQSKSTSWRRYGKDVQRSAAGTHNKFMLRYGLAAVENRVREQTPDFLLEAKRFAATGNRAAVVADRDALKRKQGETSLATTMSGTGKRQVFDAEARAEKTAKQRPPVPPSSSGNLYLDGKNDFEFGAKRQKEVVAQELEARGIEVLRNPTDGKPKAKLETLIEQLREEVGGAEVPRLVIAHDSKTAPWRV